MSYKNFLCQNEHFAIWCKTEKNVVNVSAMGHVTITSALPNHLYDSDLSTNALKFN